MSNLQATMVAVIALSVIEHDREKHVPGVKSGPQAETFLVPESVAESLERIGAVKRADVVDTTEVITRTPSVVGMTQTVASADGPVVNFADLADAMAVEKLTKQLEESTKQSNALADELAETQLRLAEVTSQLEQASASAMQGTSSSGDDGSDVGTSTESSATGEQGSGDQTDSGEQVQQVEEATTAAKGSKSKTKA